MNHGLKCTCNTCWALFNDLKERHEPKKRPFIPGKTFTGRIPQPFMPAYHQLPVAHRGSGKRRLNQIFLDWAIEASRTVCVVSGEVMATGQAIHELMDLRGLRTVAEQCAMDALIGGFGVVCITPKDKSVEFRNIGLYQMLREADSVAIFDDHIDSFTKDMRGMHDLIEGQRPRNKRHPNRKAQPNRGPIPRKSWN